MSATDASGTTKQLIRDFFNMKYTNRRKCVLESYEEIPDTVEVGTDYHVNGVIEVNYPITLIYVSLKSTKTGEEYGYEKITPYTKSYDPGEVAEKFDFSALEAEKYLYSVSAHIGSEPKIIINKRFGIQEKSNLEIVFVNMFFDIGEDGKMQSVSNNYREFSGRILADAISHVALKFRNSHPYVEFKWKRNEKYRYNHLYAHSKGTVMEVDKSTGTVMIEHKDGYVVTYRGLNKDKIYVWEGIGVDENTTVGEIPENKRVSTYLKDQNGNALDICEYLDSDFWR